MRCLRHANGGCCHFGDWMCRDTQLFTARKQAAMAHRAANRRRPVFQARQNGPAALSHIPTGTGFTRHGLGACGRTRLPSPLAWPHPLNGLPPPVDRNGQSLPCVTTCGWCFNGSGGKSCAPRYKTPNAALGVRPSRPQCPGFRPSGPFAENPAGGFWT